MKTVSADCVLNLSQTNFTDKNMESVAQGGKVMIVPSTKDELVSYTLGDKPYSDACDYMKDCKYKCFPEDKKIEKKLYDELYNKESISMNTKQIVEKIKNLFKKENVYHYDTIKQMDTFKNNSEEELYYALTLLIEGQEILLDKIGRHGRLLNRGLYYIFQPLEVTNENISLYESKIPVKTMNEHVQYEIETIDENIKTPVFGKNEIVRVTKDDEQYVLLMEKINQNLETATKDEPNELKDKNEDWYFNLNSVKCKKDSVEVEKFAKFKKTNKITQVMTDEYIQKQLSPAEYKNYKTLEKTSICSTKGFLSVMNRLKILGIDTALLKRYVTDHILDTLPHESRVILAKEVLKPGFSAITDLEKHIVNYFKLLKFKEKTLVLAKENEIIYYKIADWSTLNHGEINQFKNLMKEEEELEKQKKQDTIPKVIVPLSNVSSIVGFVGNFSSKDMIPASVFKVKNMKQARNNKGAYLQNDTKIAIIKQVNAILKLAGSPYSFDDENTNEPVRNTDDISKIAFAGIFEILMRKFNDEEKTKTNPKIWLLRPEQAIFNNIENA